MSTKTFLIERTRLVTERYVVTAEDEEAALMTLRDEMDRFRTTENCALIAISTEHSEVKILEEAGEEDSK